MFHVLLDYFFVFFEELSFRLFLYLLIRLLFLQLSFGSPSYIVGLGLQLDILLSSPFCQCVDGLFVCLFISLLLTLFALVKMLSGLI